MPLVAINLLLSLIYITQLVTNTFRPETCWQAPTRAGFQYEGTISIQILIPQSERPKCATGQIFAGQFWDDKARCQTRQWSRSRELTVLWQSNVFIHIT